MRRILSQIIGDIMVKPIYLLPLVFMTSISTISRTDDTISCNFEDVHICGYTHDTSAHFNWTRHTGPTSSSSTGPDRDHTFSTLMGHYMYIEASFPNINDTARLISKQYSPPATEQCLEFWYHMHGSTSGSLKVYFKRGENLGGLQFTEDGNKENRWLQAKVRIRANSQPFQLVFEGVRGKSFTGDIGIDDIAVKNMSCKAGPDSTILQPNTTVGPDSTILQPNTTAMFVQEGLNLDNVKCSCENCFPSCSVHWEFDGTTIVNSSLLQLNNVLRNSAGTYQCICINPETSLSTSAQFFLSVRFGPDSTILQPNTTTMYVQEGFNLDNVTCGCENCFPTCFVHWEFNGTTIVKSSLLQLTSVLRNSAGLYKCICKNPKTSLYTSAQFFLSVRFGPDSTILHPNTTTMYVLEGPNLDNGACGCVNCFPSCFAHWEFNSTTIEKSSLLQLTSVLRRSAGTYKCIYINPKTFLSTSAQFTFGPDSTILQPNTTTMYVQKGLNLDNVTCGCENCFPTCFVHWEFNGTTIVKSSLLQHTSVLRNSAGLYKCICKNTKTSLYTSAQFFLSVRFGPDSTIIQPNTTTMYVQEGLNLDNVTCGCENCFPSCSVHWEFDGTTIVNSSLLQLNNVLRNSAGTYKCICTNPETSVSTSAQFFLSVRYGPDSASLTPPNTTYTLEEGSDELEISCDCGDCQPDCNQSWTFSGDTIGSNQNLSVSRVLRNSSGQYQCICDNPSNNKREVSDVTVSVHYGPDVAIITPNWITYNKTVGSPLRSIKCTCGKCEPGCNANWSMDGVSLNSRDAISFKSLSIDDSGKYICNCSNPSTLKSEVQEFNLTVNAIQNVQPCPKDTDDRGTTWEQTLAGEIATKACQEKDSTGTISRMCSKSGTTWLIPEYNCIRSSFADVEQKLKDITTNVSQAVVTSVLDELTNLTDSNAGGDRMYSGELKSVTRALDTVATLAKSGPPPTKEQSVSFVTVASNLLSEDKKESWQSLSQTEDSEGASKLLQSIDTLSESMTKGLDDTNKSVIKIDRPNIVLEARKVDVSQKEIQFPMPSDAGSNSFQGAKLALPLQHGSGSNVERYTIALYKSLAGFLPNTASTRNGTEKDRSQMLNTPVISLQVFPPRPQLDKALIINFKHQQANFQNPKCTYWSFDRKRWESDGCQAISSTGSETTCECYHLTNFAVLMSPWNEPTADSAAIEIISIVGCSISILSLIATAAAHIALWRYLKNDRAIILINICVALTVTYIIFLSGINQTSNKATCTAVAALLHYILLVVFCLMLAEGIEITITVKYVFITKSRIKWMIPLTWGIPAVIVGLSMGITRLNGYGNENFCWLSIENGVIWAFVGPAMLVIVEWNETLYSFGPKNMLLTWVNVVFLAILLRTMLRTKAYIDMSELDRIKSSARCLCVLVPLMGCTWILGIFYVNDRSSWIQYVFALCNSLQGFFIFLFHCLLNKQFCTAVKSRHKRYKDSHSVSKASSSSKRTDVTCTVNPVYSSDVPIEAKPNPVLKYGRKLSLQFKKTGSYSPLQE